VDLDEAVWIKSSRSSGSGSGDCVEVARNLPGIVAVRDSVNPDAGALVFSPAEWQTFVDGAKAGEFDL
jgi:hypothetical protein